MDGQHKPVFASLAVKAFDRKEREELTRHPVQICIKVSRIRSSDRLCPTTLPSKRQ